MAVSKASNAVLAIAHSKFSTRITDNQLREMATLKSVDSVADYLKNTKFSDLINSSGITKWRRDSLENILKNNMIGEIYSLCGFEKKLGSPVFFAYMLSIEADEIITFLHYFAAGHPERYILTMPAAVNETAQLDLVAMSQIRSVTELEEFFKNSEIYSPLSQSIINQDQNAFNVTPVEMVLDRLVYSKVIEIFKNNFTGRELSELIDLFSIKYEITDLAVIYRSKRMFKENADILRSLIINTGAIIKPKVMEQLINCNSTEEFFDILSKTKYGKYITDDRTFLNRGYEKLLQDTAVRYIHFTNCPATVTLAYITYLWVERHNIVHIIEGVRYGISPDNIIDTLVISGTEG